MKAHQLFIGGVLCLAGSLLGCSTLPGASGPYAPAAVQADLAEAAGEVQKNGGAGTIPRLLQIATAYRDRREGREAYYWLGRAFGATKIHQNALEAYDAYLQLAPQGRYARDAAQRRAEIAVEYARAFPDPKELDARIEMVRKGLAADPSEPGLRRQLADLLWQRGDYEESGRLYAALLQENPALRRDAALMARIEPLPDGHYRVVTPRELQQRMAESRPLLIEHTHGYGAGRDRYTREHTYYVVAGEVYNQSGAILYGVEVSVTIYGFANAVYDTKTVPIGELRPKERRAFSVRMGNFETIENIVRFKCVGRFEG